MFEILSACPVFKNIPPERLQEIFGKVHHFTKSFDEGELIAFSGDTINFLMVVLEGSVKGEMVDFSGKVIKIDDIPAPQVLAAAFLFGKENRFPVNIIANEKTTIFYMPTAEFVKLLQSEMQILLNYLEVISNIARFLSEKIKFLSFKTIKGKIAQYILKLAGKEKDVIEFPVPQHILAEMFGVTRPSMARGLGELVRDGAIKVEKREIHIINRKKLEGYLS